MTEWTVCVFCGQAWLLREGVWVVDWATPPCEHETVGGQT